MCTDASPPTAEPTRREALVAGVLGAASLCVGVRGTMGQAAPSSAPAVVKVQRGVTPVTDADLAHMRQAITLMRQAGVVDKTGGPFGAVIMRDGKVLAAAGNSVTRDSDPTAHAEVNAIREACRKLRTLDLSGAVLYSSCECCPMCYASAYWARISKIYYAASWSDYADLFDDANMGRDFAQPYPQRLLAPQQILEPEAKKVWQEFRELPDGARY